jgi:hypothetical protein
MPENGLRRLVELICDEHARRDRQGPLLTIVGGRWAYCPGRGESGHVWREVGPVERVDDGEQVTLLCDDERHLRMGRGLPDGTGVLTIVDGSWSYCSAGVAEPHTWRRVPAVPYPAIRHVALDEQLRR